MRTFIISMIATLVLANFSQAQSPIFGSLNQLDCHVIVTSSFLFTLSDDFVDSDNNWNWEEAEKASIERIDKFREEYTDGPDSEDNELMHALLNLQRMVEAHIFSTYRKTGVRMDAIEAGHRWCDRFLE